MYQDRVIFLGCQGKIGCSVFIQKVGLFGLRFRSGDICIASTIYDHFYTLFPHHFRNSFGICDIELKQLITV